MNESIHKATFGDLLKYTKPYRWVLLLSLAGAILDAAMQATFAAMLKPILDNGFAGQERAWINIIPVLIIGLFILRSLGNFIAAYGFTWTGRKIVNDLRRQVFNRYLKLPQKFYDEHAAGGLISRITYDVEQIATGVTKNLIQILRESLAIIMFLSVMFYYSAKLAMVALAVFPLVTIIIRLINKRFRRIGFNIQQSVAHITQIVEEAVKGQKIIKIFKGEEDEKRRFNTTIKKNRQLQVKIVATQEITASSVHLMIAIALSSIMYLAAKSSMTPGTFMAFMTAMLALMPSIRRLSQVFTTIQTTLAAADSVLYILNQPEETDTGQNQLQSDQIAITFNDVSFCYQHQDPSDNTQALKNINLHIKAGEIVALVGASGSGKTSLVNLIPRFHDCTKGQILINGKDSSSYKIDNLRDHIAMVSQEVVLFNDTVRNNIAYGCNQCKNDEEIANAAEKANALTFIKQLPQGFDTILGDDGTRLSGGQRQRIAIARAILKNAPILILDEATSALDTESEKHIQQALKIVMQGRTTLVIAHRLSTVEHADSVVVMDHGEIAERGTHSQLLKQKGVYYQLHKNQQLDIQ